MLTAASFLPLALAIDDGLVTLATVQGGSMQPSLATRDVVLVWRLWSSTPSSYPHGCVVVARSPYDERRQLIKRLVAKEGDWLLQPDADGEGGDGPLELIGRGRVWLEGDNRARSVEDSREYGQFPAALLQGRALAVVWPPQRVQWLPSTLRHVGGERRVVNRMALPA